MEFGGQRGRIAAALVKGATTPGPGQAAMQKIYWQMSGELKEAMELSGPGGGPLQYEVPIEIARLSLEDKKQVLAILKKYDQR